MLPDATRDSLFVRAMGDGPEAESAKRMLLSNLERAGVHPSQVTLYGKTGEGLFGATERLVQSLDKRVSELTRMNRFLVGKVDRKVVLQAHKAGKIDYHGYDLDEAFEKLFGDLGPGWEGRAAIHLDVTLAQFRRWREGVEAVPEEVVDTLKMVKGKRAPLKQVAAKETPPSPVSRFSWLANPDVTVYASKAFLKGDTWEEISQNILTKFGVAISPDAVQKRMEWREPPAVMAVKVKDEGAMTWAEGWLISSRLCNRNASWTRLFYQELGISKDARIGQDLMRLTTQAQVDALRERYWRHVATAF